MLQRARGLDHNQENPYATAGPSHHNNLHHKTPARQLGKAGPGPVTGGKGQAASTVGRGVLGKKDGNQGKGGGPAKDSALLFPSKPTASSSTSTCQPFKTPAPKPRSLRPLADLQTPATALRPKRAPVLVPSPEAEKDVEMDGEAELQQQAKLQEMLDREVEYAGPSATDYEEPYEPECEVNDYKKANFGDVLRSMSFTGTETQEEWEARDAIERTRVEFLLEDSVHFVDPDLLDDDSEALFPIPASSSTSATASIRRVPLAPKLPSNGLLSATGSVLGTGQRPLPLSRKPLNSSTTSSLRRPGLQPSFSAPSTATRRALLSTNSNSAPSRTPALSSSTTTTTMRKLAVAASSVRPESSLSNSSSTRSRPLTTLSATNATRKPSTSSLRSTTSNTIQSLKQQQVLREQEKREEEESRCRRQREAEEKKLGAFGLSREARDLEDELLTFGGGGGGGGIASGSNAFAFGEDGQDFDLDLD